MRSAWALANDKMSQRHLYQAEWRHWCIGTNEQRRRLNKYALRNGVGFFKVVLTGWRTHPLRQSWKRKNIIILRFN